jgi:hypothetical protein
MSKYIRTKDGIYEPDGESFDGSDLLVKVKGGWNCLSKKEPILKKADTIEELCDEAVVIYERNYNKPFVVVCYGNCKPFLTAKTCYPFAKIYGAIWTDKGLIYVAKMNEKGELELL